MSYTYAQALNAVARILPKVVEDQYAAVACNLATTLVWDAYDWNESLVVLPPFYVIPGQQDHGPPQPVVPTDYQGLRRVQLQHYTGQVVSELHVAQNLNEVYAQGVPTMISYEAAKQAFRLYPRVPNGYAAPNYFITGTYKKLPTQITNSNLNTALPLKEKYFPCWLEALRYGFYVLTGSEKAGGVQIQDGRKVFTGQLAIAMNAIDMTLGTENLNKGEHRIYPSRPLVRPRFSGGWYGF